MEFQNPIASDVVVIRGPALVGVKGYALRVRVPGTDKEDKIPIASIRALILYGKSIRVSLHALDRLLHQRIPIILITRDTTGVIESPHLTTTPEARWAQYRYLSNHKYKILLARAFVESKIKGYANVAKYLARRYNISSLSSAAEEALEKIRSDLEKASSPGEIMNVEAKASQTIWNSLRESLFSSYKPVGFQGRNPRSRDPINQAVNYLHAIIYSITYRALVAAGLDPHLGALHREGYGRTPLVYDYSEQFKPIALRAVAVSSQTTKLRLTRSGLLTRKSLQSITTRMMQLLHSSRPTPHKQAYTHAWNLREAFKLETKYKPYIYNPR